MSATLLNDADRAAIIARLRRVTPDRVPLWGSLTAPRMLCHVTDQLRVATGIIIGRHRDTLFRRTVLKWMVVRSSLQAAPGKVQTVPEMLSSAPTTWDADMATCIRLIKEVGHGQGERDGTPRSGRSTAANGVASHGNISTITCVSSESSAAIRPTMEHP